jgi:hypothetical protein
MINFDEPVFPVEEFFDSAGLLQKADHRNGDFLDEHHDRQRRDPISPGPDGERLTAWRFRRDERHRLIDARRVPIPHL